MSFTGRYAKTGVSPTSMVRSSLFTSTVSSVPPSIALVLVLLLFASSIANVPTEARRAMADRAAVVRFLLFIIVLVWSIVRTSLVTLPCLICFLYSTVTIVAIMVSNNAMVDIVIMVASVPPIP